MRCLVLLSLIMSLASGENIKKDYVLKSCTKMCDYITAKDPNHGYACECHNITAPDGFIMQTARIPSTGKPSSKPPVFLMHGFITTGLDFVFQPEVKNSLPYLLADAGYDVWIGNEW